MTNETSMLEEIIDVAKKHGYTVSDFVINKPRIEIGMEKDAGD